MTMRLPLAVLAASVLALALGGCGKGDAPAPPQVAQPGTSSEPPGGSSGMKGSLPAPGSSGGDMVAGATGGGTEGAAQPGTGLHGGLGTGGTGLTGSFPAASGSGAPMGTGPAGAGSPNSSPGSGVGTR